MHGSSLVSLPHRLIWKWTCDALVRALPVCPTSAIVSPRGDALAHSHEVGRVVRVEVRVARVSEQPQAQAGFPGIRVVDRTDDAGFDSNDRRSLVGKEVVALVLSGAPIAAGVPVIRERRRQRGGNRKRVVERKRRDHRRYNCPRIRCRRARRRRDQAERKRQAGSDNGADPKPLHPSTLRRAREVASSRA